jgi:hypothetical protein
VVQGKLILRSISLSSSNNCLDLKNNRKYSGKVNETEIATVLPLEGRATESGIYTNVGGTKAVSKRGTGG